MVWRRVWLYRGSIWSLTGFWSSHTEKKLWSPRWRKQTGIKSNHVWPEPTPKKPLKLERQERIKKGIWGRMWLGRGNSFDACNLNLVNQQSEHSETLMRGFNTGFSTTAADADVIWQLNQPREEHLLGLCSALMEWAAESLWFEGLFEKTKILYSYRYDTRIRGK